jgi:hypothetical protein
MTSRRTTPTRWEVLGAWLHVWTPPRDAVVPPVPWRQVAVGAALVVAVVVAGFLTVVPAIEDAKERGAAEDARRSAASRRAQEARLRRDQRATVVPLAPGALEPQVAAAVEEGAGARLRAGELGAARVVLGVECADPVPYSGGRLRFACLAVERVSRTNPPVRVGQPFVAVVARDRRSLAWCKTNELAGEGAAFLQVRVPLPAACAR